MRKNDVLETIAAGGIIAVLVILFIGVILAASFFITAGLVALVCWGLASAGFAVSFSWGLALAVWIIMALCRSVFGRRVTVTRD